jgi:FkbM family methyltransferase
VSRLIRKLLEETKSDHCFSYVDVGAMGGIPKKWALLVDLMKVTAFEPDDREFRRLKKESTITYLNYALADVKCDLGYYIAKAPGKSSIFEPNSIVLSRFPCDKEYEVEDKITLPSERVTTLDSLVQNGTVQEVDFAKLDTQGSELLILKGSQENVLPKLYGVQIEVEFIEIYKNQPLFREIDGFMLENGFELIDLRRQYWKRGDFTDFVGKGQLVFGDALYFKRLNVCRNELARLPDPRSRKCKVYKCICICLVYGTYDIAFELAQAGLETGTLSRQEFSSISLGIAELAGSGCFPEFPQKRRVYNTIVRLLKKMRPKSYLGWSDSDRDIANIVDE